MFLIGSIFLSTWQKMAIGGGAVSAQVRACHVHSSCTPCRIDFKTGEADASAAHALDQAPEGAIQILPARAADVEETKAKKKRTREKMGTPAITLEELNRG